ncbi:hypothetical protein [Microbacterium lacticum]
MSRFSTTQRDVTPALVSGDGQYRPAPRFVEWLMGLPDGWVTAPDLGLTSPEQLTALGNGVVPAQAVHALGALRAAEGDCAT